MVTEIPFLAKLEAQTAPETEPFYNWIELDRKTGTQAHIPELKDVSSLPAPMTATLVAMGFMVHPSTFFTCELDISFLEFM